MKYRIVGTDGRIYGPVGLDQIRRWISEGRAEARTPVYVDGASGWTTLGLLPELAPDFGGPPPPMAAYQPVPARETNGFATAGLVCGLLSWTCCCCVPFNLLGLVFSIIALAQISSQSERQEGRVFAIIGLVLSVANLCFGLVLTLLQVVLGPAMNWPISQS